MYHDKTNKRVREATNSIGKSGKNVDTFRLPDVERCSGDGNRPIRLQGRETSCRPHGHPVDGPAPP